MRVYPQLRVRELTRRLTAMVAAGLTELQGVTADFWGGPQLQLWPQPPGGPAPLARMYRELLGRRACAGRGL